MSELNKSFHDRTSLRQNGMIFPTISLLTCYGSRGLRPDLPSPFGRKFKFYVLVSLTSMNLCNNWVQKLDRVKRPLHNSHKTYSLKFFVKHNSKNKSEKFRVSQIIHKKRRCNA